MIFIGIFFCISISIIWLLFIKSTLVVQANLLSLCINSDEQKVRIELMESIKYISKYSIKVENNILHIDIYSTTIFNPFAEKTNVIQFSIPETNEIIILANKKIHVNLIPHCKAQQINNTIIPKK